MGSAAPSSSPSCKRRCCSMDDVMRRARAVDAPPPVARARRVSADNQDHLLRETCGSGDRDDDLLVCNRCDHTTAAASTSTLLEPLRPWRRWCSIDDVLHRPPAVDAPPPVARARVYTYYQDLRCETCGSGDRDEDLLLCDRCVRGHHSFCLRPIAAQVPLGPWFCPVCAPPAKAPKSFPLNKTKIFNFFGIQEDEQDTQAARCRLFKGFPPG